MRIRGERREERQREYCTFIRTVMAEKLQQVHETQEDVYLVVCFANGGGDPRGNKVLRIPARSLEARFVEFLRLHRVACEEDDGVDAELLAQTYEACLENATAKIDCNKTRGGRTAATIVDPIADRVLGVFCFYSCQ